MTKITSNDVRKVAQLARLELSEDQIALYTSQLEKILGYVAQLEQVDTQDVPPTSRAVEVINVLREDLVKSTNIRNQLLDQAPEREGYFYRVPKIMSE